MLTRYCSLSDAFFFPNNWKCVAILHLSKGVLLKISTFQFYPANIILLQTIGVIFYPAAPYYWSKGDAIVPSSICIWGKCHRIYHPIGIRLSWPGLSCRLICKKVAWGPIHSFIHSFIYSFFHSFIHSFIDSSEIFKPPCSCVLFMTCYMISDWFSSTRYLILRVSV